MMYTYTQIFFDYRTASRAEFACIARVNLHATPSSVFSFVRRKLYELIPSCVLDGFTKTVIANHPFDIQIFKGDDSEHRNESMAELMSKVATTISDALMDASHCFALLFSLGLRQRFLIRAKESWVSYLLTCGKCRKRVQANVNAY